MKEETERSTLERNAIPLFVFIQMQFGINTEPWSGAHVWKIERINKHSNCKSGSKTYFQMKTSSFCIFMSRCQLDDEDV